MYLRRPYISDTSIDVDLSMRIFNNFQSPLSQMYDFSTAYAWSITFKHTIVR